MSGLAGTAPHLMTTTASTLPTPPTALVLTHQIATLDITMTSVTIATMEDATAAIVEATGSTMMNATIMDAGTTPTPIILPAITILPTAPTALTAPPLPHLITLVTKMISMTIATTTDAEEKVSPTGFTTTIAINMNAGIAPHMLIPTTTLLLVPPTTTHTALKTDTAITP